ncbi:hypothetical protein LTR12_013235 [Friedmanniomyces endolithicus]|nr:hypothetical protein LTR74_008306 [Friedmanniomyces endolithicus]KAK1812385.1 hypothetical protein LTR12_013235 [Friedmanniomyces endolithicus]
MGHGNVKAAMDSFHALRSKLPATVDTDEKANVNLTPAQKELLGFVVEAMNPSFDWAVVVDKIGYTSSKNARAMWYVVRKKFAAPAGDVEKASSRKRKAGAEPDSEEIRDEAAPAKKTKRAAAKKKTDEDGGDEAAPAKKPKRATPKKAAPKKAAAAKKGKKGKKAETPDEDCERAEEKIADDRSDAADAGSGQEDGEMFT